MKLDYPVKRPASQTQGFSENANSLYKSQGLISHGGYDFGGQYGDAIYAAADCYLYSTVNMGGSPAKYRAIYTLIDDKDFSYEASYGHVMDCTHELRQFVKKGTPIGRMGNFGSVYSGGRAVTEEERLAGSHAGTHLHFQARLCKRVKRKRNGQKYLRDGSGDIRLNGSYYEIVNYDNGTNGCVPIEWTGNYANEKEAKFKFENDLKYGDTHPDVKELQKFLNSRGFHVSLSGPGSSGNESEYFGGLTRAAVIRYQLAKGISPAAGFFGPLTRESANAE